MKTGAHPGPGVRRGYALALVLILMAISALVLAGAMQWTSNSSRMTERHNRYTRCVAAAEAATEIVLARMMRDFQNQGVNSSLDVYRNLSPVTMSNDGWVNDFVFSDGQGNVNQAYVNATGPTALSLINSQVRGLYGITTPYRVVANARPADTSFDVAAGVQQDFQLASIPVFQFAIFYGVDLEINPGPVMDVTGRVHGNADLYVAPASGLRFHDAVTAVGTINLNRHPNDPTTGSRVDPVYEDVHDSGVAPLTLPIGTNNSPTAVRGILEVPPPTENANSPMGRQRYYNKADLIIEVRDSGVTVRSGVWNSRNALPQDIAGTGTGYSFVRTNATFYNGRENKTIRPVDIDVQALDSWMQSAGQAINNGARAQLGHDLNSVYVDDQRAAVSGAQPAVRVLNGQQLPDSGLSVITKYPIYVQGHFNAPDTTVGSQNTSSTKPASLVGDSINVLSSAWQDSRSTQALGSRVAGNTTVNAAFLGGIVESTLFNGTKYYSGGVENFPRFLEDWGSRTLTYNGSMVVLFPSQYATSFWRGTGSYYNPPIRRWAFDLNFLQQNRLPPGTPQIRSLIRSQWTTIAANRVN